MDCLALDLDLHGLEACLALDLDLHGLEACLIFKSNKHSNISILEGLNRLGWNVSLAKKQSFGLGLVVA